MKVLNGGLVLLAQNFGEGVGAEQQIVRVFKQLGANCVSKVSEIWHFNKVKNDWKLYKIDIIK